MRTSIAVLLTLLCAGPVWAQRLPTTVRPTHYDLTFTVDLAHARFEGTETIAIDVLEPTNRVVLNAADISFRDVSIGHNPGLQDAAVAVDAEKQQAAFTVPRRLERGPTEILVHYSGVLNDQLRGFYVSRGRDRNYAVTQFESTDARRAFPCFDEPSFKATFAVTLVVDRSDGAISNGRIVSDVAGPTPTKHRVTFATTPKMSSYLVAIAVGDFQCSDGSSDGIPIRVCATPDKKNLTRIALESAEQILHFYDSYYAIKYPFGKLDILAVPDFAAGAMENTAAIFYRETDLLADARTATLATRKNIASVLAHEMAHQWFGDLVTMAWWDDLWLNEGFVDRSTPTGPVDEEAEMQTALNLDSLKSTRPIHQDVQTPAEIDEAFDSIAYEKGAAVLRMVESYIGGDVFRKGINAYLQAHAYGNATSEDFWKAIAASSQKPVDRILPTFVNQPGIPLIGVSVSCERLAFTIRFTQQRFLIDDHTPELSQWQVPICSEAAFDSGMFNRSCTVIGDRDVSRLITDSPECPRWVFANAGARGYYRTEYPPAMLRAMAPDVEARLTPAERLSLVDDEWAMVRAGRHGIGDYLSLVTGYGRERVNGVFAEIAARLDFVHQYLTTGTSRDRFEGFVRQLIGPVYREVGFSPAASDDDDRRALRATAIESLGVTGNDPEIVAKALDVLRRSLARGETIDPVLADALISVAAPHGDQALFDAIAAEADRATSPDEHYRYLYGLTQFTAPALVERALERVLRPDMRSQDAANYLARFLENPAARDRAWRFLDQHWHDLAPQLTVFGADTRIVSAAGAFCDARSRDAVKTFFAAHPLPAATRTLEQTLERIDNCIALHDRQAPQLAEWLARR